MGLPKNTDQATPTLIVRTTFCACDHSQKKHRPSESPDRTYLQQHYSEWGTVTM
jgi:hypothetical protein